MVTPTATISDSISLVYSCCHRMFDSDMADEDRITFALSVVDEMQFLKSFDDEYFLDHELEFLLQTIRETGNMIMRFNKGLPL